MATERNKHDLFEPAGTSLAGLETTTHVDGARRFAMRGETIAG
jgi:hypothetical protein